jgi:hypothetical protein
MAMTLFASTALSAHGPAGEPSGDGIQPTFVDGNRTCAFFGYENEIKIQPVIAGATGSLGSLSIEITAVYDEGGGPLFDWEATGGTVEAVFVKGGPGGNLYEYVPADDEDTRLHSPVNPQNHKYYGLSHISFCFGEGQDQGDALEISKTVNASAEWTWAVEKSVDGDDTFVGEPGSTHTFNYDIVVTHDDGTFTLDGVITVQNPNADLTVEGVVVTDELFADLLDPAILTCTVEPQNALFAGSIGPGGTELFDYTCAVTDMTAEWNVATVAWGNSESATTELDAGDASVVEEVVWDKANECVDVWDDKATADTSDDEFLGEVCADDPSPTPFTQSLTFTVPDFGCDMYTNTASVIGDQDAVLDTDDATVTICSNREGCTPGYWKQSQHFDSWTAPYVPTMTLGGAGFVEAPNTSHTLLQALNYKGGNNLAGAKQILLRAAVAALLNEASGVNYAYPGGVAGLLADVNWQLDNGTRASILALATDLDERNNEGSCPLN